MKHPFGGGEVADQAEARPAAFIDTNSRIFDRARVHSGKIINSTIGLDCRVYGATIQNSIVTCDEVVGATVIESGLFGQSAAWDQAYLYRAELTGGARVYGNAKIIGSYEPVKLWGDMRVLTGVWHRSPQYEHLGFCFLTESVADHAMVDCKHASYARWFRIGERYARRQYGWTLEQLQLVRDVFTIWEREESMDGKHWGDCVPGCKR